MTHSSPGLRRSDGSPGLSSPSYSRSTAPPDSPPWSPSTDSERENFAAAVALEDKIYLFGGNRLGRPSNEVAFYDSGTHLWTDLPPMANPRDGCAAAVLGRSIYVVGGCCVDQVGCVAYQKAGEVFDTTSKEWTIISSMKAARSNCAAIVVGGKLYVFGGYENGELHRTCEVYDPQRDSWDQLPAMKHARDQLAATSIKHRIYLVGGEDVQEAVKVVEVYNTETNKWEEPVLDMNTSRKNCSAAFVKGAICVYGGTSDDEDSIESAEVYDSIANVWTTHPIPPMKSTPHNRVAAVVGEIFFFLWRQDKRSLAESFAMPESFFQPCGKRKRQLDISCDVCSKRLKDTAIAIRTLNEFLCPITTDLPVDPVIAEDGRVFERSAIEQWVKQQQKEKGHIRSPVTNELMGSRLVPAIQVRNVIKDLVNEDAMINDEQAKRWKQRFADFTQVRELERLASGGEAKAMCQLGLVWRNGEKGLPQDDAEAYKWFKKASDLDHVAAMAHAGMLCLAGSGTTQNVANGMLLLGRAEALGSDYAAFRIAELYETGKHGMSRDVEMSKRLYRRIGNNEYTVKHLHSCLRSVAAQSLKRLNN